MNTQARFTDLDENDLATYVIGVAIDVHRTLGPGLFESAYLECLHYKLQKCGFNVEREVEMPVVYEDVVLDCGYRLDLLVEKKLVLELKSVDHLLPIHTAQILTYLKMGKFKLGLLMNFKVPVLKDGIKRVVNNI